MSKTNQPNLLIIMPDQVRASALSCYGQTNVQTPHIDRLAQEGCRMTQAMSTAPVCTPFRSMLLTGRHPQSTGHVVNFMQTRHDEIGMADAFAAAGYRCGYVGKWHLARGAFPHTGGPDYVPEGRDRLGFQHWRGYNFHMDYLNGTINLDGWHYEHWDGYETDALPKYLKEFIGADNPDDKPFFAIISPHQCHFTPHDLWAPDKYYKDLPDELSYPDNVPEDVRKQIDPDYRNYLAMLLAVDEMTGAIIKDLEDRNILDDTIILFCADHGTAMGSHGIDPYEKKLPYEHSLHIPFIVRYPKQFAAGSTSQALISPVDIMPSLSTLCNVPIPQTVEGQDQSSDWINNGMGRDTVLTMNFIHYHDFLDDGNEWRGVRNHQYSYARWLDGKRMLYDILNDPLQMNNLIDDANFRTLADEMEHTLLTLLKVRGDAFEVGSAFTPWFDEQRRVVANAYGPLPHPESKPDWSLLKPQTLY